MDNSDLQVLRWGIPGWVTILTYVILVMSINNFDIYEYISVNKIGGSALTGFAAIFIALGVPIGYLVYQFYFNVKWFLLKKHDLERIFDGVVIQPDLDNKKNKETPFQYWQRVERTFDANLTLFFPESIKYDEVMRRYNSLKSRTDRIHGLGASLWGMFLSTVFFIVIHNLRFQVLVFSNIVFIETILSLLIIWVFLFVNYYNLNKESFFQMKWIMYDIQLRFKNENQQQSP